MAPSFCPVWGSALLRAEAEKRKEGAQPVQGAEQALSRASTKKQAKQLALVGKNLKHSMLLCFRKELLILLIYFICALFCNSARHPC